MNICCSVADVDMYNYLVRRAKKEVAQHKESTTKSTWGREPVGSAKNEDNFAHD